MQCDSCHACQGRQDAKTAAKAVQKVRKSPYRSEPGQWRSWRVASLAGLTGVAKPVQDNTPLPQLKCVLANVMIVPKFRPISLARARVTARKGPLSHPATVLPADHLLIHLPIYCLCSCPATILYVDALEYKEKLILLNFTCGGRHGTARIQVGAHSAGTVSPDCSYRGHCHGPGSVEHRPGQGSPHPAVESPCAGRSHR